MPTTALHVAAVAGHLEVVQLLLKRGANPCVKNQNGRTASQLARNAGHTEVADFLTRAESVVERRAFCESKPRISVSADDIRRQLWTRSISPAAANAGFVCSFNKALDDHSEAARAAAAYRRVALLITNIGGNHASYIYRLLAEYYHQEDHTL